MDGLSNYYEILNIDRKSRFESFKKNVTFIHNFGKFMVLVKKKSYR